jgi:two-component sensor histidine kinase
MASVTSLHVEAASTLAVVASSNEPLLFLAADLKVIAASASFCRAFQIDPASVPGRPLADLGSGEWALPQVRSLLKATAAGTAQIEAYEIDLIRKDHAPRYLVLNARKLDDGDEDRIRLLLAITDVTHARAEARQKDDLIREKDDLIREKAILLQEVQHRVANSLQIIASVLMQSARKVQSEEARGHLRNAHHRVMSIAAVQRHLAESSLGNVTLRPYFIQLCESLGASMIHDPERLSIVVIVDDSVVTANASVSLGLIITELVINALKHAFPEQNHGKITVEYRSDGEKWTLSVNDDGIGMPKGADNAKPGLGTGIIEALAKQLGGNIRVSDTSPGTSFTLVHDEGADSVRPVLSAA